MMDRLMLAIAVLVVWGLTLVGAHSMGHTDGAAEVQALWDKQKTVDAQKTIDTITQHNADMAALEARHRKIERETNEATEERLAGLRAAAAADRRRVDDSGGLRIAVPAAACPGGQAGAGAEAPGAKQRDEAPAATIRLPRAVEDSLWAIVNDADELIEQAQACQDWIRKEGFYGTPAEPED